MKCPKCGEEISKAWLSKKEYCPNCGAKLGVEKGKLIATAPKAKKVEPTKLWYLAPLILHILGGILGYLAVKDADKKMAKRLLIVGIAVMAIEAVIGSLLLYYGIIKLF